MEKEINNINAEYELDEASLEQVTGGIKNSNGNVIPGLAIGGGADTMAAPDKAIVQDNQPITPIKEPTAELSRKPDVGYINWW